MANELGLTNKHPYFTICYADGTEVTVAKPVPGVEDDATTTTPKVYTREYLAVHRPALFR